MHIIVIFIFTIVMGFYMYFKYDYPPEVTSYEVIDLTAPIPKKNPIRVYHPEVKCIADNIYHEARGLSLEEQVSVAYVTYNRVLSPMFPDTFCGVVHQPYQFSWTLYPSLYNKKKNIKSYIRAIQIAEVFVQYPDPTNGALFYYAHNKIEPPHWSFAAYDIVKMEGHVYFKL